VREAIVLTRHYFLATALPVLGEPGTRPPLTLAELAERLEGSSALPLVSAILLEEDLLQRDACLAGELPEPRPAVLSPAQAAGRAPLPDHLTGDRSDEPCAVPGDAVWAAYARHVAAVAAQRRSAFLAAWIGAEVGLRNALVVARARRLGLDPAGYLVARELAPPRPREDAVLAGWAAAAHPLAGFQLLLRARWAWLAEHEPRYSFGDDELAAYAVRLVLLHRWYRASHEGAPGLAQAARPGGGDA
jgi:hypothetical protein